MKRILITSALAATCAIASAQGPWLGMHQEVACGIKPQKQTILGLYVNRNLPPNEFGRVTAFSEIRLGYMGWKVSNDIFNSEPCLVFESDTKTSQTAKFVRSQDEAEKYGTHIVQKVKMWVSLEGRLMREQISQESPRGNYFVDAVFGTETVELSGDLNGVKRDTTMYPVGGTVMFDNLFKPMMKDGKVILPEKEFYLIDPVKMTLRKCKAKIRSRFNGELMREKFKGNTIEITTPEDTQVAYISEEGDLLRVDLPDSRFFLMESLPASRDPLQKPLPGRVNIRGGNGGGGGKRR
jgi:hypothetical protein